MAITPRQELRQGQALVMTPQLQQAIKLLQLSNLELSAYVEQELEQNPLLEHEEAGLEEADGSELEDTGETWSEEPDPPDAATAVENDELPPSADTPLDIEPENVDAADGVNRAGGDSWLDLPSGRRGSTSFEDMSVNIEQFIATEVTRREHLFRQLNIDVNDPVDRLIGAHLIESLDEAGYIVGDIEAVAEIMGCPLSRVEQTLSQLQSFDPTGIFARSLRECLALQLRELNRFDPAMETLLDNLDLLARGDVARLVKLCGVDREDIADMAEELRALNPKPGLGFQKEFIDTLIPDVFVRQNTDGGWRVELNSETLPRLLVNNRYHAEVNGRTSSKKDKAYVSERLNAANWLIKSLDQRANTILRVASELVRQQEGFFLHGVGHLKPLTLRNIAEVVEMHESTVSRVTSNKYMATPRGTFELKYFFTSAIAVSNGGDSLSAESVRHRIKALIDNESEDEVLSDDRIVEILAADHVEIARRTVAKYRETMRIPSSVERRRRLRFRI